MIGGAWSRRATGSQRRRRAGMTGAVVLLVALCALPASAQLTPGLAETRQQAEETAEKLAKAEHRLHELEHELVTTEARASEVRAEVAALEAQLGEAAVARFVRSGTTPSLLPSEDFMRQVRGMALGRSATQQSGDVLERYAIAWEDLHAAESALQAMRAEQEQARAELQASNEELTAELARLEELDRQAQEAQRLGGGSGEIRGTAAATSGSGAQPARPGQLAVCPVAGPHTFIDSWGFGRSGGRRHKGVDMMASRGVPTVAPVSGTVTHRGNRVGGLSYHLEGDDGNYYYGTHLSGYGKAGRVEAGDVIGYVGDTGNARGMPHLHFEIHPGGRGSAVNPYPYVAAVC